TRTGSIFDTPIIDQLVLTKQDLHDTNSSDELVSHQEGRCAMARWTKGQSGNPRGRPKTGTAIAELARRQLEKHKLVERLGSIAAGQEADVDVGQQLRAIQLLM